MRAAIFDATTQRISIEDFPMPSPGMDELLVQVRRCGICGSDALMTSGSGPTYESGRIGHEYAGEIVGIGPGVSGFLPGQRVVVLPVLPCGACDNCHWGNPLLCEANRSLMQGFGEYAVVPSQAVFRLPDSLSFADAAMVEPMACGLHAMKLAGVDASSRVLVIGGGTMALSVIYWARRLGARRIVVLSRSEHRNQMLRQMGADDVTGFATEGLAEAREALGGGADIVAECVGKQGMLKLALDLACVHGTVLSMGLCVEPEPITPGYCNFKETRLLFPIGYTVNEFEETVRAFDADGIRPGEMVSETISLDALPSKLEAMRSGSGGQKVQVDPSRGFSDD